MENQRNIEVEIVADSINPAGKRIVSALWTYPRFIHSEIMTHRALSKNAASSRAIPSKKMLQAVDSDPAMPEFWGSNQSGMQAGAELTGDSLTAAKHEWRHARLEAMQTATILNGMGLHKQIANRVLEPWFRITVLVTATDWDNFFALRAHPAAQPEFQVLAYRHLDKMLTCKPKEIDWGDWHIPFDLGADRLPVETRLKASVASAARTSYVAYDSDKSLEEQIALHDRMWESSHWSPFEHQAMAARVCDRSGNFSGGWLQYRQTLKRNVHTNVDFNQLMADKPAWITL